MSDVTTRSDAEIYAGLTKRFDQTRFRDGGGRTKLEYIDGEQCFSRLNQELGFMNWDFTVLAHGLNEGADEFWVLGQMIVRVNGATKSVEQFGSQKIKRSRSSGTALNIGFDLKGATTDAAKKCATMIGVALYLYSHDEPTVDDKLPLVCSACGTAPVAVDFPNGTSWSAQDLIDQSLSKTGVVYCFDHLKAVIDDKRKAQGYKGIEE
jgi:hypothetical protein